MVIAPDHPPADRVSVVRGGFGSGKTTWLADAAARLCGTGQPVLAVLRDRRSARRFERDVLALEPTAGGLLVATTFVGFALDVVRPTRLLVGDGVRTLVRSMLSQEGPKEWPTLAPFLARPTFADHVAETVLGLEESFLGREEMVAHADAAGVAPRWAELTAFADRYRTRLADRGWADPSSVIVDACLALRGGPSPAGAPRWTHVVADDVDELTSATQRLLTVLLARATSAVLAGNPDGPADLEVLARRVGGGRVVELDPPSPPSEPPSEPSAGPSAAVDQARRLVLARHRAIEGDAVVAELLSALQQGRPARELAVLTPTADRLTAVVRSCRRHRIPIVTEVPVPIQPHPAVLRLQAVLATCEATRSPGDPFASPVGPVAVPVELIEQVQRLPDRAGRAWLLWQRWLAPQVIGDDEAIDAVAAFLADPDADVVARSTPMLAPSPADDHEDVDAVTLTTIERAAGRRWPVVIVPGCVEGSLPRSRVTIPLFDPALYDGPDVPEPHERQREVIARERRRFRAAMSRATTTFIAVAAPEPGVLPSRFVEGWTIEEARLPGPPPGGRALRVITPTVSAIPVHPGAALRLSATQIEAFTNCGWNYALQYGLGIRGDGSVSSRFGSLVHAIFEAFLRPGTAERSLAERSLAELQRIAEDLWDDSIFDYRPQATDYRRRLDAMLDTWWESEGATLGEIIAVEHRFEFVAGPHVLNGSIDRVDAVDGGIAIVDYKTGAFAAGALEKIQLPIYHLAALRDETLATHGPPVRLRLNFLAEEKNLEYPITPELAAQTEARIEQAAAMILAEQFEPSVYADCQYCDLHRVCPLMEAGREVPVTRPAALRG